MNPDSDLSPASYDDFPYPSYAYAQSHPDYLATLAILSDMTPAAVEQCRVLELGCASGGNLIPMAYSLPGSEFVGIDFSGHAISQGLESIGQLGIENIILHQMDFMDVDGTIGQFDYIVAHGIFSWVPPEVQAKILEICRDHLAPQGVIYISYNVFPGWHMYRAIRDAMFYHTQHVKGWPERVQKSRWLVEYLSEQFADEAGFFGPLLQAVQMLLNPVDDGYIRHDFLAEVNDPLYFHQFIERAGDKGLKFLANGRIGSEKAIPPDVMDTILELAEDTIAVEQYLDFVRNRSFRETLLCHESCPIQYELDPRHLKDLLVNSRVKPEEKEVDLTSTDSVVYIGPGEKNLSTAHPLTKAALTCLESQYPKSIHFPVLVDQARKLLSQLNIGHSLWTEEDIETLAYNLLRLHGEDTELISFHTFQPRIVAEPLEKPLASAVARHQIEIDMPVANLYNQRVNIDKGVRRLLLHLDGHHDRQALLNLMFSLVDEGVIEISKDDQPVKDPDILRSTLQELLDMQLESIADAGLLVSD